ncbi:MAG: hypothetical protein JW708_08120, partial [Vallitaleaceae bacterium]|nr:hypothetical protein [Vallitaleaceae bacterium]
MMKKVLLPLLSILFFMNTSISAFAYTDSQLEEATAIIEESEQQINNEIDKAVSKSVVILDRYERGLLSLTEKDQKIQTLISQLIHKTNQIAQKTQKKCNRIGVEVQCTYIYINIDGQEVAIDPFIIVG